jgi:5-methylthioadenosine/S-adenosylhomocysteine deaminase
VTRTLLRGARVVTMAVGRPDAEHADMLIDGDCIKAIDAALTADDVEILDLTGRIVIPGLVNAHLHTWQTALRGVGGDWTLMRYITEMHGRLAEAYRPEDLHIGMLAGALNQIGSGTTTLGDWCHNNPTPDHTDAALDALEQAAIRAVFFHGAPKRPPDVVHPVTEVDRILEDTASSSLLSVGIAANGPQGSTPDVAIADFEAAVERGAVISVHQSGGEPGPAWDAVRNAGLFGPHANVVHGAGLGDDWVRALAATRTTFTSTPENELGQGHRGTPIVARLRDAGAQPSLGTDTEAVVAGELLTAAHLALAHQRGIDHARAQSPLTDQKATAKDALSWVTVEGARALGLEGRVGRLQAGMQADLTVIDARALNLSPANNPIATALNAGAENIEAVMIGGRWRKRDHRLVDVDLDEIKGLCESAECRGSSRCQW